MSLKMYELCWMRQILKICWCVVHVRGTFRLATSSILSSIRNLIVQMCPLLVSRNSLSFHSLFFFTEPVVLTVLLITITLSNLWSKTWQWSVKIAAGLRLVLNLLYSTFVLLWYPGWCPWPSWPCVQARRGQSPLTSCFEWRCSEGLQLCWDPSHQGTDRSVSYRWQASRWHDYPVACHKPIYMLRHRHARWVLWPN